MPILFCKEQVAFFFISLSTALSDTALSNFLGDLTALSDTALSNFFWDLTKALSNQTPNGIWTSSPHGHMNLLADDLCYVSDRFYKVHVEGFHRDRRVCDAVE